MFIDVFAAIFNVPFEAKAPHKIIHPIEAAQHRAFATTGGTDERGDGVFLDRNLRITYRFEGAVVELLNIAIDDHLVLVLRCSRANGRSDWFRVLTGNRLNIHGYNSYCCIWGREKL